MRRRQASFRKHAPNSLAMLFGPMPTRTATGTAKGRFIGKSNENKREQSISTLSAQTVQSAVTTATNNTSSSSSISSVSILSQEDVSGIPSDSLSALSCSRNTENDSDTSSVEPENRRAVRSQCIAKCGMMTRSKLRRKLQRAKSKKASPRKSSLTSLQMVSECHPTKGHERERERDHAANGGGDRAKKETKGMGNGRRRGMAKKKETECKECDDGQIEETPIVSGGRRRGRGRGRGRRNKEHSRTSSVSRKVEGTGARRGSRKRKRGYEETEDDRSGSDVKDYRKRRKLRARSYSSLSNF